MKAVYLVLVFSSPLLVVLVPGDWFEYVWLPIWIPFAVVLGAVAFFRPRSEMFAWIVAAPVLFWLLINAAVPVVMVLSAGGPMSAWKQALAAWGQMLVVTLALSTPIGFMLSAYWMLAVFGLFAVFRARSWIT